MKTGCQIPWHWHSASENLMIVSGSAHVGMRDEKGAVMAKTVTAGAFVLMPAKHVHEFRCEKACEIYLYSDGSSTSTTSIPRATSSSPPRRSRA